MSRPKLTRKSGQGSQRGLTGKVLVLDSLFYDTLLYGVGQDLQETNAIFSESSRINQNRNLCNLEKVSEFGKSQFNMHRLGLMYVSDGAGLTAIQKLQNAMALTYYSRIEIEIEGSRKQQIWGDQIGAGGGLQTTFALDASAAPTDVAHINNGIPTEQNQWAFRRAVPFEPGEMFTFKHVFMTGLANADPTPIDAVNGDATSNRLYRVYARGIFGRPVD